LTLVDTEKTAILPFFLSIYALDTSSDKYAAITSERPLAGTKGPNVPYFFEGDEGCALNKNILRPFGGSKLSGKQGEYKNRLCRARRFVDRAFGILSNKWRIFQRPLYASPDFEVDIVKAGVALHNFVRERDGCKFEDALTVNGLEDVPCLMDNQHVVG
jgi:hypothetical protein